MMEPMAGGYGARPHVDGMDTGGLFCIPMGRIPDAEMTEFLYPILMLWRREVPDSGGPGRQRGGVAASVAITPHGTSMPVGLVLASAGKAVAQNDGFAAVIPATPAWKSSPGKDASPLCSTAGTMPGPRDLGGQLEPARTTLELPGPGTRCSRCTWQGGGGYGDPLPRDPRRSRETCGRQGHSKQPCRLRRRHRRWRRRTRATSAAREGQRAHRRERALDPRDTGGKADLTTADAAGRQPRRDAAPTGPNRRGLRALRREARPIRGGRRTRAGPARRALQQGRAADHADPADYVDDAVVFRQYCCPNCWTALYSGIVPVGHVDTMTTLGRLTATTGA